MMMKKKQGLTFHKTGNVKYYVSVDIYLNRENNVLKYLANATYVKHEADTVFPYKYPKDRLKRGYFEKYVYEVLNHNVTARIQMTKGDFILTTFRPNLRDNYRYFDFQNEKNYWDNSTWSEQLKNNFFAEGRRIVLYKFSTVNLKPDDFISPAKKEILALMTSNFFKGMKEIKNNQAIQSSFFLYDRSNIIKKTFVNKINEFLPIMCSFGYFGKTTDIQNIDLISSKTAQRFYIEKNIIRDTLAFELKHVSGIDLETDNNKLYEILFTRLSKSKKSMNILDFLIIRGQQVFEEGRDINPIEIKIEDNRVRNLFEKYKDNKVSFKFIRLPIASSVVNDTEKIFLQTTGLKSAKYALLNEEYKQIIGIANLKQIENWDALKESSKWGRYNISRTNR